MSSNDSTSATVSAAAVLRWARLRRDTMIDFLETLVRQETPSDRPDLQGPLFAYLETELAELDYVCTRVRGDRTGGYLYARPRSRRSHEPMQLLVGHGDTVWPKGTVDERPPRREDDLLYGPGAFDMKAGLVQGLFALRALRELDLQVQVRPHIFVNSDEEIGSPESTVALTRLARRADRAFVLEPALGAEGHLKTARKSGSRFHVGVKGRSAHAGLDPERGISAVVELSRLVQQLHDLNDPERGVSVNVGTIRGGERSNVVADRAEAVVDVRVRRTEDLEPVTRRIESLQTQNPESSVEVEGRRGRPPMEFTDRNRALWKRARTVGDRLGLDLGHAMAGGSSDGNTTSRYTASLDGLGAVGDGAHAEYEHVRLDRMPVRTALLALLLTEEPLCTDSRSS